MSHRLRRFALGLALAASALPSLAGARELTLLNVSYDPTRELYQDVNAAFAKDWKAKTGDSVTIKPIARRLGQAGARGDRRPRGRRRDAGAGLRHRRDRREHAAARSPDWQKRLPQQQHALHLDHRVPGPQGQPEGHQGLGRSGQARRRASSPPNPKTSGGARWNYLAAWGYALRQPGGTTRRPRTSSRTLYNNVPVLDSGARGATHHLRRARHRRRAARLGERGASWRSRNSAPTSSRSSTPSVSASWPSRRSPSSTRWSTGAARARSPRPTSSSSTRAEGAGDRGKQLLSPASTRRSPRSTPQQFPKVELFTIDEIFGGWAKAQKTHFADGGVFDQIYSRK